MKLIFAVLDVSLTIDLTRCYTRCWAIAQRPRCRVRYSFRWEDWNSETIFYGHYRSIFNHCDIIGLKIWRNCWQTQNKGYYSVQGHSRISRSVPIESPYATFY